MQPTESDPPKSLIIGEINLTSYLKAHWECGQVFANDKKRPICIVALPH